MNTLTKIRKVNSGSTLEIAEIVDALYSCIITVGTHKASSIKVADKVVKLMIHKGHMIKGAKALIMGITFKENCPDVRNTRVVDIYHELISFGLNVDVVDPWADKNEVKHEYGLDILNKVDGLQDYDAIIVAVAHDAFLQCDFQKFKKNNGILFDTKACLDRAIVDGRL